MRFAQTTGHILGESEIVAEEERVAKSMLHSVVYVANNTSLFADAMLFEAMESSTKRRKKEYRDVLRSALRPYLQYVNCNLVLANTFQVGFHDWADFSPFYERKFLAVGQESPKVEESADQVRKLFTVPFPEFAIRDNKALLKTLEDKRIGELRKLVTEAVEGKVVFDEEFAKRTLTEVLRIERQASRWRNITSYITIPVGLIPWLGTVLEKMSEGAAGRVIDRYLRKDYQWYYLLSDVETPAQRSDAADSTGRL